MKWRGRPMSTNVEDRRPLRMELKEKQAIARQLLSDMPKYRTIPFINQFDATGIQQAANDVGIRLTNRNANELELMFEEYSKPTFLGLSFNSFKVTAADLNALLALNNKEGAMEKLGEMIHNQLCKDGETC